MRKLFTFLILFASIGCEKSEDNQTVIPYDPENPIHGIWELVNETDLMLYSEDSSYWHLDVRLIEDSFIAFFPDGKVLTGSGRENINSDGGIFSVNDNVLTFAEDGDLLQHRVLYASKDNLGTEHTIEDYGDSSKVMQRIYNRKN